MVGAICLGALISGDVESAKSYHFSLQYHLGDPRDLTDARTAPSLGLAAVFWQHRGEDQLNAEWVGHARRVLTDTKVRGWCALSKYGFMYARLQGRSVDYARSRLGSSLEGRCFSSCCGHG